MFYKNTDNKVNPPNSSKDVKENSVLKLERKVKVLAKRQSPSCNRHMVALSFCLSPGQTSKMPAEKKKEKQRNICHFDARLTQALPLLVQFSLD